MLELFSAWRTVMHIGEWTGLSLGALGVLALLVWLDPPLLKVALKAAVAVLLAYACILYGNATGRADVERQWDAAKASAAKAQQRRDAGVARDLEAKYHPQLEDLTRQALANQEKADALQKQLDAGKGRKAGTACQLGRFALRLRRQ